MKMVKLVLLTAMAMTLVLGWSLASKDDDDDDDDDVKHREYKVRKAPEKFLALKNPHTSKKDRKKGRRYYRSKCADCHGDEGEGDEDDKEVVAFKDKKWMSARPDGQLFYIAMYGGGEESEMEAYGPESDAGMKEERIWQIIAYIRTLAEDDD